MALTAGNYDGQNKKEWEVPAKGPYRGCVGAVWDIGIHDTGQHGLKSKVCVAFELDKRDAGGKRFIVFGSYTRSAHPSSALRPVIDATLGENLSAEMQENVNLELMVGKTIRINIDHTVNGKPKVKGCWGKTADMTDMDLEGDYSKPFGMASWLISRAKAPPGQLTAQQTERPRNPPEPQPAAVEDYDDSQDDIPF